MARDRPRKIQSWLKNISSVPLYAAVGGDGGGSWIDKLRGLLSVGARATGGVIIATLSLSGSSVKDKDRYKYVTYIRRHTTIDGLVYSGRTGGLGSVDKILEARSKSKDHLERTAQGYGPLELDRVSYYKNSIRGREQMLIDFYGGAQSIGGTSGNKINGIWPFNYKREMYMLAAEAEFGSLPNNAPFYKHLQIMSVLELNMKNLIKKKHTEGSVFAIPLESCFVYGLVCKGGDMCFFDYVTETPVLPENLQEQKVLFRVGVHDSAPIEGEWIYVGSVDLVGNCKEYNFYYNKPVGSDVVYLYSKEHDSFVEVTEDGVKGLEVFAAWFAKNINDRISKHLS